MISAQTSTASVYYDFQRLHDLKSKASTGRDNEALKQVAKQFESIFMQMVLM